jgi:hypothetical protein
MMNEKLYWEMVYELQSFRIRQNLKLVSPSLNNFVQIHNAEGKRVK